MKVALVGDESAGKRNLLHESALDPFSERYVRSIGVNVLKKVLELSNGETVEVDVLVYDVLGVESLRERLCDRFLHGTKGILAVCDAARPETVEALDRWIHAVRRVAGDVPAVVLENAVPSDEEATSAKTTVPRQAGESVEAWFRASREDRRAVEHALDALGERIVHRIRGSVA